MKKFLAENKLGPYAKARLNEDIGGNIGDAEAEKEMDFLAEDGDETWFSDMNYFKKEHEGYKLKPTDMISIGDIPAMTYAQALKKFIKKEEGYMGTQYDSSEDMAVDMLKKGITREALEPHVYERMYNLSNIKAQQTMIRAAEIMMRELTEEGFEVEEVREFFTQLIANDI
jgi:hypothetical protein